MGMNIIDRESLDFGGDMSADRRTRKIDTRGCKSMSAEICWPATGSPVGTVGIEVSDDPDDLTGFAYPVAITAGNQPNGSAGGMLLDHIETDCDYIVFTYTAGSGGVGANFCDRSGDDLPRLLLKE
jgi:hypothetical protein